MQMPPAGLILARVLPHFPSITGLMLILVFSVKYQQPIMICKDSWDARDFCCTQLDFYHGWVCCWLTHSSMGNNTEKQRRDVYVKLKKWFWVADYTQHTAFGASTSVNSTNSHVLRRTGPNNSIYCRGEGTCQFATSWKRTKTHGTWESNVAEAKKRSITMQITTPQSQAISHWIRLVNQSRINLLGGIRVKT